MSEFGTNDPTPRASRTGKASEKRQERDAGHAREQARELIGQAGSTLKHEAQSFAHAAQDRVRAEAQRGTQAAGRTLGDFANAVRRAGDDLDQSDHSPASRLVLKAADGLETFSRSLADKDPGDLLNTVRDFGRRNPAAFIGGAVLVGLALGRLARASERPAETRSFLDEHESTVLPAHLAENPYDPTLVPADDAGLTPSTSEATSEVSSGGAAPAGGAVEPASSSSGSR